MDKRYTHAQGPKPQPQDHLARHSRLRSSLRSKMNSLFGRRPQSCHLERFDINAARPDLTASSQSLYTPVGTGASPSLDAFLDNVLHKSNNPNRSPPITSLVNSSGYVSFDPKVPGPTLRNPTRRRPVSIAECYSPQEIFSAKGEPKPKEKKSYMQKVVRQKEKLSASISSLSSRIKGSSRRDLTSIGEGSSDFLSRPVDRTRRNTITGTEESPYRPRYQWNYQPPTFCSFPENPEEDHCDGGLRHIDSSSEEDLRGALRPTLVNSNPICPFSPFTRSRSEFLDISRVRAARSKFLASQGLNQPLTTESPKEVHLSTDIQNPPPLKNHLNTEIRNAPSMDIDLKTEVRKPPSSEVHMNTETETSPPMGVDSNTETEKHPQAKQETNLDLITTSDVEVLLEDDTSELDRDDGLRASRNSLVSQRIDQLIKYVQSPIEEDDPEDVKPQDNARKALHEIHSNHHFDSESEGNRLSRTTSLAALSQNPTQTPLRKVSSFHVICPADTVLETLSPVLQEALSTKFLDAPCSKAIDTAIPSLVSEEPNPEEPQIIPVPLPCHELEDSVTNENKVPEDSKSSNPPKKLTKRAQKRNKKRLAKARDKDVPAEPQVQEVPRNPNPSKRRKRRRSRSRGTQKRRCSQSTERPLMSTTCDDQKAETKQDERLPKVVSAITKSDANSPSDFQLVYLNTLIPSEQQVPNVINDQLTKDNSDNEVMSDLNNEDMETSKCDSVPILLENLQELIPMDDGENVEAIRWVLTEGEDTLSKFQEPHNTSTGINAQLSEFNQYHFYAKNQLDKGTSLLEKQPALPAEDSQELAKALTKHLEGFTDKINLTKDRLEDTAKCYLLLDKGYEWALSSMKVVSTLKSSGVASPDQVGAAAKTIATHLEQNPPVSNEAFEAMIALANKLNNPTLVQQCKNAQARCQETISLLTSRQTALLKARRQMEFDCQSFVDLQEVMGGPDEQTSFSWLSNCSLNSSGRRKSITSIRSRDPLSRCSSFDTDEESLWGENLVSSTPQKQQLESRPSLGGIKELRESAEDLDNSGRSSVRSRRSGVSTPVLARPLPAFSSGSSTCSSSESSGSITSRKHKNWKCMQSASQTNDDCPDSLSEESLSPLSSHGSKIMAPSAANSHLLIRGSQINLSNSEDLPEEEAKRNKRLLLITQELIQTERDYVRSLEFIIENYIPELLRDDIPQALRGQRNVIFGNLEKIFEFHSAYFLEELEACTDRPFNIGSIFLKYETQFYLYALYNKNKPKCDSLMAEYGTAFFRGKQLEIGDKMDLSSYLLKPVQRMGKYALLLKQLLKECHRGEEGLEDLTAAQEMVQFQLRHGNDLLAMDSLRDCDVNLKEQGRLLRQGELYVSEGNRRKSIRHVFLFEDMILFSKSRRDPEKKTLDIFQYKCSMKMTDIGLTEQIGDNPLKFEIWFRKRKPSDTYILQAPSLEVKETWTVEISKLLWRQALKNRSMRLHEMSSMGIGNKPCLDIRPNEDQIFCRSVCIHNDTKARLRPTTSSPAESTTSAHRPNSIISVSSSASSAGSSSQSSATGPSFAGTLNLGFEPGDSPRPLQRSVTRTSQCSAESGILVDMCGDKEDRHTTVERSNSTVTSISVDSGVSHAPPQVPPTPTNTVSPTGYIPIKNLKRAVLEGKCDVKERISRSMLTTEV